VVTDTPIGGSIGVPSGIPHPGSYHAFDNPEPGFNPPESPQAERGGFKNRGLVAVNGR
jgi:hypothetical protein